MGSATNTIRDSQGVSRCWWCGDDPLYQAYHDQEWGRKVTEDRRLFEKICLEGFQAGLSWLTILRKRENFRESFHEFEIEQVAKMGKREINRLLKNEGIIRHRGKIESTINNARLALKLLEESGSLHAYFDTFAPKRRKAIRSKANIPSVTEESKQLSKDLKRRGWSFVGPTTCYAFMQSMGLVNDHLCGCSFWEDCEA